MSMHVDSALSSYNHPSNRLNNYCGGPGGDFHRLDTVASQGFFGEPYSLLGNDERAILLILNKITAYLRKQGFYSLFPFLNKILPVLDRLLLTPLRFVKHV